MRSIITKLSVTRQFTVLAVLGLILTLAGLSLTLKKTYDFAFEAKRVEIRHLTEAMLSNVRILVDQAKAGSLTEAEAKKRAADLLIATRYDHGNYIFAYTYDGTSIANPKKASIGANFLGLVDSNGKFMIRSLIEVAKSGEPGYVDYMFPKAGNPKPLPKISYAVGVPEWQWMIGTGVYVDDIMDMLINDITSLAALFLPLFAGFLIIVYIMRRSISALLASLAESMRRVAQGDLDTSIAGRGRHDEIGQMAEALVTFKQAAIDKGRLQGEADNQRHVLETERRRKAEIEHAATQANRTVVDSLGSALASLSHGDLSLNVTEAYAEEYEEIRRNFNAAVAQLRDTMGVIASNTQAIRTGSVEIATAADDLSQRTERQAATLAETAATLNQVAVNVGETAQGAILARKIVTSAMEDAGHGGTVVRSAVAAMSEIEKSAQQIAQIIGVIDEIAFQTNLLALNAGVEAARAGDAGRGFAVVASEVRGLAQRSAEAAKDIKALISASTTQVGKGVAQVAETGTALDRIQGRIAEMNGIIAKIADSAQHQATSLGEVNAAIEQMDKTTQQNAAMVEESTAASHSLAAEADVLASLISRFSLGSGQKKGNAALKPEGRCVA